MRFLIATILCGAAIIGIYVGERFVITDRERIEASIHELADAFARRDEASVIGNISPRRDDLIELVQWGFATVTDVENLSITDVRVDMNRQNTRAQSHFRANGRIHVLAFGDVGHKSTRWEFTWERQGTDWKIIEIQRLNPITGEEMDQRAARE